ncbi:MAG: hypothetical protein ACJ72I_23125 [Pseudonocardiaceae bacterium]
MFVHTDPADRPAEVFGGTTTLVSGPDTQSYLLLPRIPQTSAARPPDADPSLPDTCRAQRRARPARDRANQTSHASQGCFGRSR